MDLLQRTEKAIEAANLVLKNEAASTAKFLVGAFPEFERKCRERVSLSRDASATLASLPAFFGALAEVLGDAEVAQFPTVPAAARELVKQLGKTRSDERLELLCQDSAKVADFLSELVSSEEGRGDLPSLVAKGLPTGVADGGVHVHVIDRDKQATREDGAHEHLFHLPRRPDDPPDVVDGGLVFTFSDGVHSHSFDAESSERTGEEGVHSHMVPWTEPNQHLELWTSEEGPHSHELQSESTCFDGAHQHELELPDGTVVRSLTPYELWELIGPRKLKDAPPAHLLAELTPFAAGAMFKRWMSEGIEEGERALVWKAEPPEGKLPALKLPDPAFNVARLQADEPSGFFSRVRRVGRVKQPQALVNETAGNKDSYVWAVVAYGEPEQVKSIADVSEAKLEGVDQASREEFAGIEDFWYMPLKLLVVFDPPLKLKRPAAGRRFGSDVDLQTDVTKARQLGLPFAKVFRDGVDAELEAFVANPHPQTLEAMEETELRVFDRAMHAWFEDVFAETDKTSDDGTSREDLVNAHVFLLAELGRREIMTPEDDALGEASRTFQAKGRYAAINPGSAGKLEALKLDDVVRAYDKPMRIRDGVVCLVGSVCNDGATKNDVDVLLRGPLDEETKHVIEFRLGRALAPEVSDRVNFHYDPLGGPFTSFVKLYDLVLVPHEDRQVKEMSLASKADDPLLDWPKKPGKRKAVFQYHFRGKSLHGDLRMLVDKYLVGWTLALQKKGVVPDVNSLSEARKVASGFDVEGGKFNKSLILPSRIVASPKSRQPRAWLDVQGEVFGEGEIGATSREKGVMVTVANPDAEWGLQKPFSHEYFLTGDDRLSGRLVFRLLVGDSPVEEEGKVPPGEPFWTAGFTKVALPSVLATRAVETKSMPPLGHSAMPESLMKATPTEFQFWKEKSEKKAREVRDALVEARVFTPQNIAVEGGQFVVVERKVKRAPWRPAAGEYMSKAKVDFTLSWQRFKGQTVVRGVGREVFHIVVAEPGGKGVLDFQLQSDPLGGDPQVLALLREGDDRELLAYEGDTPAGTTVSGIPLNRTKQTPSNVSILERASAEVLDYEPGKLLRVKFDGKKLDGVHTFVAEEVGGDVWQFSPGEDPGRSVAKDGCGELAKRHSRARCMECSKAPEVECLWADGRGRAWFCREHFKRWAEEEERDIVEQRDVDGGEVAESWGSVAKAYSMRGDVQVWDPKDRSADDDKGGDRSKLRPPATFLPMKPADRASNSFRDLGEAAKGAFTDELVKAGVLVEPKFNGFRVVVQRWNDEAMAFTEDSPDEDILSRWPTFKEALLKLDGDFVLDGEAMQLSEGGGYEPRRELADLRGKDPDDSNLRFVVFDALYLPKLGNLVAEPLSERRAKLEAWVKRAAKGVDQIELGTKKLVDTRGELADAMKALSKVPGSEGAMLKAASSTYSLGGENDLWAKVKLVRELKALVVERHEVKGSPGVYNFTGAIGPLGDDAENWKDVVEHDGKKWAVIGVTGNRKLDAKVGDTIRVETLELLHNEAPPKTVAWFGPAQALEVVDAEPSSVREVLSLLRPDERVVKSERPVRLLKSDQPEERYVFGVVLVPNEVDAQGDIYDEETVRKAAHAFLEHFAGSIKIMHRGKVIDGIKVLESYVSKVVEEHGGEKFPVGTWFLATRAGPDEVWMRVKDGSLDGYSMGGTAVKEALRRGRRRGA